MNSYDSFSPEIGMQRLISHTREKKKRKFLNRQFLSPGGRGVVCMYVCMYIYIYIYSYFC